MKLELQAMMIFGLLLLFSVTEAFHSPMICKQQKEGRRNQCRLQMSPQNIIQTIPVQMLPKNIIQTIPVGAGIFALVKYHTNLQKKEEADSSSTWRSVQAKTRVQWSQFVRETEGWLYAIQTLRNAITANTFLATTVLSLLTVVSGKLWTTNVRGTPYAQLQFAAVALTMLRSAYEFLQSARLMTHAGFMFPVEPEEGKVDNIMRRSSLSQWLGLRWLYIGGSMLVWAGLGEFPFLITSLLMVRFFNKIDRPPA